MAWSAGTALRARCAVLATLGALALAGTASADPALHSEVFFDTFMTRCMFSAHSGRGYVTDGMVKLGDEDARYWLGDKPGSVWAPDPAVRVLLIVRDGAGCSVVSQSGDAAAVEKIVRFWFEGEQAPFVRDSFERAADGGFASHYRADCPGGTLCRVIFNVRGAPGPGELAMMASAARVVP